MSPSCVCDAATQPPAHTGMNAQSPHSFHGMEPLELVERRSRASASRRPSMWPVDMRQLAGEAGAGVERAVGTDRVRVRHVHVARAVVHAVGRGEAVPLASPRAGTSSCRRGSCTMSQADAAAGADRRHAGAARAACRRAPTGVSGMHALRRPTRRSSVRTIGLKLTLTSLSANSCACRKSSSAGIAVHRALVEVAANGDAGTGRRRAGCSR